MRKKTKEIKITTLVGEGCVLNGDFSSRGSLRIDGSVEGSVTTEGCLIIGATGSIGSDVSASSVLIGGTVMGNVNAPEKVELTSTAKVFGDITTAVIVIDENAVFQGKCDMNRQPEDKKNAPKKAGAVRASRRSAKAALAEALKEVQEENFSDQQEETAGDSARQ